MTQTAMAQLPDLPPPIERPKWAYFLWRHGLGIEEGAAAINRSREYARQLGLPWGHPKRATPTDEEVSVIAAWSRGEVTEKDWSPPSSQQVAA